MCHGKPTFRGTRVIVWQVLQMIADGIAWATMVEEWGRSVTKETVAEAVRLAGKSSAEDAFAYALELALA